MNKTVKSILVAVSAVMLISSCHGDLDIQYGMTLNSTTMWKDPSDLEKSVPAIYLRLRAFFAQDECNVFYLGELRVGDYMWGPSLESKVQDNFKGNVQHSTLSGSQTVGWSGLFSTIDQANAVLLHSGDCRATAEKVAWANAHAYFARAYCYFWAARIWGYCPVNLLPVESQTQPECYPEQRTPADLYAQVESDILACEECGDVLGSSKYLGTKDALNMLKAEYALWMYRTQQSDPRFLTMASEALSAIGISNSRLLANYADVFDRTKKVNQEIVFALNNTATSKAGYQIYFCQPADKIAAAYQNKNGGPVPISSTQWWSYTQNFVDILKASESAGDKRVKTNLGYGPYSSAADKHEITWCNKLLGDMSVSPVVLDNDLIYYRYALAVMMDAELKYYQLDYEGALKSLNLIAKRAYGVDNKYTSKNPDDVLKAITDEYVLEFPAEGVIWFALIRLGQLEKYNPAITTFKAKNPNILLWPIANGSINKNPGKIKQVEGWA